MEDMRGAIAKRRNEREKRREDQEKRAYINKVNKGGKPKAAKPDTGQSKIDPWEAKATRVRPPTPEGRRPFAEKAQSDPAKLKPKTPPVPAPIDDRSDNPPERRPRPMIQPLANTAPPQSIRSQAAHTYGYTPEWYKESRQIPIRPYGI
jgi:hypothetical protein